jgi:hypothetical protein
MSDRYQYKGKNLTALILLKIEHVVNIIAEKESTLFKDAYRSFLGSNTFKNLQNTETLLWSESAEFIADDFFREMAPDT